MNAKKNPKKKIISKSYARDNWSYIVDQAKAGNAMYVSDRGQEPEVAIVSTDLISGKSIGKFSIKNSPAFGMWKDRKDMKDSVEWVRERRRSRKRRLYEDFSG